jgi:hypothetical protein
MEDDLQFSNFILITYLPNSGNLPAVVHERLSSESVSTESWDSFSEDEGISVMKKTVILSIQQLFNATYQKMAFL